MGCMTLIDDKVTWPFMKKRKVENKWPPKICIWKVAAVTCTVFLREIDLYDRSGFHCHFCIKIVVGQP